MLIGAQKRHIRSQTRETLYDLVVIGRSKVLRCHKDDVATLQSARLIDGRAVSYTEAALTALTAGCDMVLLCNQSVGDGQPVDELIAGMTEAQVKAHWQPSDASEERRQALLPQTRAPAWDGLMVSPAYMQALDALV